MPAVGATTGLVQTASASSTAEMTIEGLHNFELVRDFLYARMRGHHAETATVPSSAAGTGTVPIAAVLNEAAESLREAAAALKALREK